MDRFSNAIVIGSSGGIGGALTRQLIRSNPDIRLIGTSRTSGVTPGLFKQFPLDLQSPHCIDEFAQYCNAVLDSVDLVICASGALAFDSWWPEKKLSQLNNLQLQQTYQINAAGPITLMARLEPLLKRSSSPKVVALSAQIGSIGDNRSGGWLAYRMAKTALNMGLRSMAIETARWRNPPIIVAVHPGTTHTRLSAPFIANRRTPVKTVEQTANEILNLVGLLRPQHNGQFLSAKGEVIEW